MNVFKVFQKEMCWSKYSLRAFYLVKYFDHNDPSKDMLWNLAPVIHNKFTKMPYNTVIKFIIND